jgi:hypothetical protein
MAKDTRGLPGNEPVKKDIAAKASASDAKIAKIAKDSTPEQVDAANASRLGELTPNPKSKSKGLVVDPVEVKRSRRAGMDPVDGPSTVFVPKGTDPEAVVSKVSKRVNKRRGKSPLVPPVPTQTTPTPGKEKQAAVASVGTAIPKNTTVLDFGKLPSRPASGASQNATSNPDVAENLIDRLKSGMGLPGEEKGTLDLAVKLHAADLATANSTGKRIVDVDPGDAPGTPNSLIGKHHHRLAKVMQTFKISDQDVYKSAASAAGQKFDKWISSLHDVAQEHEDSKRIVPLKANPGDFWKHPTTGKVIPISENHPDMPASFTRTKQEVAKVSRNTTTGEMEVKRGHQGWHPMELAGTKARVFRQVTAPTGLDFVDHLRAQMLSEHGPSVVSRKKSAAHAGDIIDQMQSSAPRGMVQIGTQKVAETSPIPKMTSRPRAARDPKNRRNVRPHGSSKQPADMIYTPNMVTTEVDQPVYGKKKKYTNVTGVAPFPPKPYTGKVLLSKVDTPKPGVGKQFEQLTLPGTGEPDVKSKTTVNRTEGKDVYQRLEGPLEGWAQRALDWSATQPTPMNVEDVAPKMKVASALNRVEKTKEILSVKPTDREWTRQRSPQFAIDTTDMTGAQEVKALSESGELASQKPVSKKKDIVLRPGGKEQAAAERRASQPPVQMSMFPKIKDKKKKKVAETAPAVSPNKGRQFYRPGVTADISEQSKVLQGVAERKFGRQPNNKDFETDNERSLQDKLESNIKGEPITQDAIMKQYRAENPKPKKAAKPRKPKK